MWPSRPFDSIDADQFDFADRAEQPAQAGSEFTTEPFVKSLERAHLLLGDAFGTLEVVDRDLRPLFRLRSGVRRLHSGIECGQQRFDF